MLMASSPMSNKIVVANDRKQSNDNVATLKLNSQSGDLFHSSINTLTPGGKSPTQTRQKLSVAPRYSDPKNIFGGNLGTS